MAVAAKLLLVTGVTRKWENYLMQAASTRVSNAWDSPPHRPRFQVLVLLLAKTHGRTPQSILQFILLFEIWEGLGSRLSS